MNACSHIPPRIRDGFLSASGRPAGLRRCPRWLTLLALGLSASTVSMGQTNSVGQTDEVERSDRAAFALIAERNIFNPNRSGRAAPPPPRETPRRPTRVESFSLVGTLSYEKGRFAIFDGSGSEFRLVLAKGGSIAGYTVEEIRPNEVRLKNDDGIVELGVSSGMRREDDGDWRPSSPGESVADGSRRGSGGGTRDTEMRTRTSRPTERSPASGTAGGGAADEDANEVLRRLMQLREQELK